VNRNRFIYIFTFSLFFFQCDIITDSKNGSSWENLNFPEQPVYVLFLDGNDLYVGAGYDGLWVLDISRSNAEWEYLGHRVTEGERHFESGVQTINVHDSNIIIGYIEPIDKTDVENEIGIGVWRSKDRGNKWEPADKGVRAPWGGWSEWSSARSIIRSTYDTDHLLLGYGSVYKSEDGGESWYRIYPEPEIRHTSLYFGLIWHPTNPKIIWAYGETNRFQPLLMRSIDEGRTWEEYFQVNVPRDNAFYSMAFDAGDSDIIYIGAQAGVIRSTKGGKEWIGEDPVPALFTDKQGGFFYAMQTHPTIPGVLFAGAGSQLYASNNYGQTVYILDTPSELTFIIDMWYDAKGEVLYVAGDGGVFRLNKPMAAIP